ncbi:MAG: hypothetical protein AAGI91_14170 [Bacteroidota bacterium]
MRSDLLLRRKLTLRADGPVGPQKVVFVKKHQEGIEHVLMKAFLWALYLPAYPAMSVEVGVGDRYKPDLVQLGPTGAPEFWGESGKVSASKIASLVRRYPSTHFALAKWAVPLGPFVEIVEEAVAGRPRRAPFDLLRFPPGSRERFVSDDGTVTVAFEDLERVTVGG